MFASQVKLKLNKPRAPTKHGVAWKPPQGFFWGEGSGGAMGTPLRIVTHCADHDNVTITMTLP